MNIQEIKEGIAAMEEVINSPSTSSEEKELLSGPLAEARKKLNEAEAKKDESKPPTPTKKQEAPKKEEVVEKDAKPLYEKGDTWYLPKSGKEVRITDIIRNGKQILYSLSSQKAKITEAKLQKKIASELVKEKPVVKKKEVKSAKTTKKTPAKASVLNWQKKLSEDDLANAEQVVLATTFKAIKAKEETRLVIKDVAKVGDTILVNEDNHLHGVLTSRMSDRFIRKGDFAKTYVRKETFDKVKKELERMQALFEKANAAKRKARKADKPAAKPAPSPSSSKKPKSAPTPAPPAKKEVKPSASKKKAKCGPDGFKMAEIVAKVVSFLEKHSIQFHQIHKSGEWLKNAQEVKGVYLGVGKAPSKIYVHLKNHAKGFVFAKNEWHTLCLSTWKLTKIAKSDVPKPQQRRKVVKDSQLKAIFTTKGAKRYKACTALYAELYKCQQEGNCSEADKAKYKEIYKTCGNLGRKFEILEEQMDTLYTEAREIRDKEGLAWSEAIRVAVREQRARAN